MLYRYLNLALLFLLAAVLVCLPAIVFRVCRHCRQRIGRRPLLAASCLRNLTACLRLRGETADLIMLRRHGALLSEALIRLQEALRDAPALPVNDAGEIRILELAATIAESGPITAEAVEAALSAEAPPDLTSDERDSLPLIIARCCADDMNRVLQLSLQEHSQRQRGTRLARRMVRSRSPLALLGKTLPAASTLDGLMNELAQPDRTALHALVTSHLAQQGLQPDVIRRQCIEYHALLADEALRICTSLEQLRGLRWHERAEAADPLHRLLLTDPSGVYPRMKADSRRALRTAVNALAARHSSDPLKLAEAACSLAADGDASSIEACTGYYFTEPAGRITLMRSADLPHRMLFSALYAAAPYNRRIICTIAGVALGFLFLHARQPLLMLPAFLLTAGDIVRSLIRRCCRGTHLPGADPAPGVPAPRTLVVLHAALREPGEAASLTRQLHMLGSALPQAGVTLLLMTDPSDADLPVTDADGTLAYPATQAIDALNQQEGRQRYLYLQRARQKDDRRFCYTARRGRRGALECICRLIAQGESSEQLHFANFDPSALCRQYDYVLLLDEDDHPNPGMLEALLAASAHPANTRMQYGAGSRGYSILQPEITPTPCADDPSLFTGTGLIRPDVFLEATDGMISDAQLPAAALLEGALAGCATVHGAMLRRSCSQDLTHLLHTCYHAARRSFLTLPWQCPWMQTANGPVHACMPERSRYHLREEMRRQLVPAARAALILWGAACGNVPLLLTALLLPGLVRLHPGEASALMAMARDAALLPAIACSRFLGTLHGLDALIRQRDTASVPAPNTLLRWGQLLLAAAMGAICVGRFSLTALLTALLWGCIPFISSRAAGQKRP